MDATSALADLAEISSHIETGVLCERDGAVIASTFAHDESARPLAATARDLLETAAELPPGRERRLMQLEVALREGSVFVVRDDERLVAVTTSAGAPSGLVLYDLRSCLRAIDGVESTPEKNTTRA